MVNGVNGNLNQDFKIGSNIKDIQQSKYFNDSIKAGATIVSNEEADTFSSNIPFAVGSAAVLEGIPLARYIRNNKKLNGKLTQDMVNLSSSTQNALKNIKNGNGSVLEKIGQYIGVVNKNRELYSKVKDKAIAGTKELKLNEKLDKAVKKVLENDTPKNVKASEKIAEKLSEVTKKANEVIEPAKLEKGISNLKAGHLFKMSGAGPLLLLSGLIESVFEVYPTFKELGSEKGMKQLGKSAVKVAADTAGFIAGQQAGMAVGSAIGTALFPGIGTAIGGAVGLACGMLGSCAADKLMKNIVGKSERELAKENQVQDSRNNLFAAVV